MHKRIEDILKNNILKSFNINRKIKASDFNKKISSQKINNIDRNEFSNNMKVDKTKPVITFSTDLTEENELEEIDFSENEENQEKNIEEFDKRIITAVKLLNELVFNDLNKNIDLDKEATIVMMNIITKMIYNCKNITIEDLKNFRDKNF